MWFKFLLMGIFFLNACGVIFSSGAGVKSEHKLVLVGIDFVLILGIIHYF